MLVLNLKNNLDGSPADLPLGINVLSALLVCLGLVCSSTSWAETYSYDNAGRLTDAVYDDGSSVSYTYDNNGNILAIQNTAVAVNTPPVCNDVSIVTIEDTAGSTAPDCTDADNDPLIFSIVAQGSNGTAAVAGSLNYTPDAGFVGGDSFSYVANDGTIDSNIANVGVTVNPTPPVAADISVDPMSHDFGQTIVSSTASQVFTIDNNGNADLVVGSIILSGGDAAEFSITIGTCPSLTPTLATTASCTIDVAFNPASAGAKSTLLRISSNDPDTGVLDLNLNGNAVDELIANAGIDQAVDEFNLVMLDGSASTTTSGTIISYDWVQLNGPLVVLSDATVQQPTFIAPDVAVAGAALDLELTVMNDLGMSSAATVTITVNDSVTPAPANITNSGAQPVETNVAGGAQGVVLMRFVIDLPYETEMSSLTLQGTGTGDVVADVTNVSVYEDLNVDGAVDAGDALVGSGQYAADGTLTLTPAQPYGVGSGRREFLVTYDFTP